MLALLSVLSSCVLAAAPLRLQGGGVSASDGSGPSCLSCSISSGLSPAPLVSIADYNNHICIFFHFFVVPGDTTGTLYLQVAIIVIWPFGSNFGPKQLFSFCNNYS